MTPRHIAASLTLLACLPVAGVSAQTHVCVPGIGGLGGVPIPDGVVDGYTGPPPGTPGIINYDPGWNSATRWTLTDGGVPSASKFQAGFAGGFLYLSYVVDTPTFGQDNTIVIGFAGTNSDVSNADWRIHITPSNVANPAVGAAKAPFAVVFWRDGNPGSQTYWNNNQAGTNNAGHWTYANTRWSRSGTRWSLEIKIPIHNNAGNAGLDTGVYLPTMGTFKFYTNVLSTFGFIDATVVQDPLPLGLAATGGGVLNNRTPDPDDWAVMSLYDRPAECTGVSLSWADVGVKSPSAPANLTHEIRRFVAVTETTQAQCDLLTATANPGSIGPLNEFVARPRSNLPGPANSAPVSATFRMANWGLSPPQAFDVIGTVTFMGATTVHGVTSNPTGGLGVPPGGGTVDLVANWNLNYKQSCNFKINAHQCIQVDLESANPATPVRFTRKSVQRNMDFVPLSKFERTATIAGDWSKVLGKQAPTYRFGILVETDHQFGPGTEVPRALQKDCTTGQFQHEELVAAAPPVDKGAQVSWIARGILVGNETLTINGSPYKIGTRAGGFGYVGTHVGPISGWNINFTGTGLTPVKGQPGVYTVDVPHGKPVELLTTLEATEGQPGGGVEGRGVRVFVDLGANVPIGHFGETADGGFSFNAGVELFVRPRTSVEGILGYHTFDAPDVADEHAWQLSTNLKQYFGPSPWRVFVNGGVGLYDFGPAGTTEVGFNFGGGMTYDVRPRVAIEAVVNHHNVTTSGDSSRFFTVQGGVRIRLP